MHQARGFRLVEVRIGGRAVPADVPVDDEEDMIVEVAAKLIDGGRDALREKTEWVLHSIACRAAIKAGHEAV